MSNLFFRFGLAFLITALLGGGLNIGGIEIPVLRSVFFQVVLGHIGLIFIALALLARIIHEFAQNLHESQ